MSQLEQSAFTGATAGNFSDYYNQVRGYVREQVTQANLSEYIDGEHLRVLDVGGGEGRDAVWLAKQGHSVDLIDPSAEMIALARKRATQAKVADLVHAESGDPARLLQDNHEPYDLVLSHGVLMYVEDPQAHLRLLHDHVAVDGLVSVLTKGKPGFLQRLYSDGKVAEALELERTGRMVNNLERDVLAMDEESMKTLVGKAALSFDDWFGVRIVSDTDRRWIDTVETAELAAIMDMELRLSHEPGVRGAGQMLHFICERED